MLVVTDALIDRMLGVEIANLQSRLQHYAAVIGNPSQVSFHEFGGATAFVAARLPVRFYNSVLGVGPETIEHLDAICTLYDAYGVKPSLEIVPSRMSEELGKELARRDFAMLEFHAGLARPLDEHDTSVVLPEGVTVEVTQDIEQFLDVYLEGWGHTGEAATEAKVSMRGWTKNPSWTLYLARLEGEPAGAGVLDLRGDTAMLGSASTRPSCRGRRVQQALIDRRRADAAGAGATLVVSGAYFGTTSMRNQLRSGFSMAFTRGIWVKA